MNGGGNRILFNYLLALSPVVCTSVYFFGMDALRLIAVCVVSCTVFDAISNLVAKKKIFSSLLEAATTGILLAMCFPPSLPCMYAVAGSAFAVIVAGKIFSLNGVTPPFNSVLAARVFLLLVFTSAMSVWTESSWNISAGDISAVTSATPLDCMNPKMTVSAGFDWTNNALAADLFFGNRNGSVGETSSLAILAGGLILILTRTVSWRIPISFLATVFLFALLAPNNPVPPTIHLLSGGLLFAAFFLAGDQKTSPSNPFGQIIFGFGCGLLTMIIRTCSSGYPEGVAFAILVMNAATPAIDKFSDRFFSKGAS